MTMTAIDLNAIESYSDTKPVAHTVHDHAQLGAKLICFKPGQGFPPHHTEAEAFFLVIKGSGKITIGSEVLDAEPGAVIAAPPKTDHAILNTGTEPLALLLVQSPNPFFCC